VSEQRFWPRSFQPKVFPESFARAARPNLPRPQLKALHQDDGAADEANPQEDSDAGRARIQQAAVGRPMHMAACTPAAPHPKSEEATLQ
jgi:hypothetical protein